MIYITAVLYVGVLAKQGTSELTESSDPRQPCLGAPGLLGPDLLGHRASLRLRSHLSRLEYF